MNKKWLKLQNEVNPEAGIRSWGVTSMVGNPSSYLYLDAYPNLDAWIKGQAARQTPARHALNAEFNATATCSSNRVYRGDRALDFGQAAPGARGGSITASERTRTIGTVALAGTLVAPA